MALDTDVVTGTEMKLPLRSSDFIVKATDDNVIISHSFSLFCDFDLISF